MFNSYNLDLATECVKNIVDGIRCTICDRIDEDRSRYACGHASCLDCAQTAQSCLLCLTPGVDELRVDEPLTRRAKHAAELLSAFQNTFHIDVLRRHRISEQLKLEKELFPQCIQAPQRYFNKRRSSKSIKDRDDSCVLPGELVEPTKMASSRNYVQDWLESNENELIKFKPRKALSDLKINSPLNRSSIKKRADIILEKVRGAENQPSTTKSRKRSSKTAPKATSSQLQLDKYLTSTGTRRNAKEVRRDFEQHVKTASHVQNEKDESCIVMNDEPIVIEDSQSQVIDKDNQAWLAVLKACENESDRSQETTTILKNYPAIVESFIVKEPEINIPLTSEDETKSRRVKVPFYKKGSLLLPLKTSYKKDIAKRDPIQYKAKDLSITIETQALVTTIQVTKCPKPFITNKVSKSVQTDLVEDSLNNQEGEKGNKRDIATETRSTDVSKSQDLFTGAGAKDATETAIPGEKLRCYVINDSSSDSEHEDSSMLVVSADVHHRESDNLQRGVLTEIDGAGGSLQRANKRSHSPASSVLSSNSSNKENRNPNVRKRPRDGKKRKKIKD